MNGRMIGVIGGTGRVGRECLRYLHENTAFGLLIGGRKPPREALPGSFLSVDVFDEASLARFCGQCSLVINCAGPASAVRERVAAAALAGGCHYVDPGGYTPLFPILSSRRPEIRAKRLTFLLTLGILPGLSELFPVYVARTCFDQVEGFEYACVGRDRWTFPSAWDIAWGVGNIGNGEAPVYYEQGVRRQAGLLASGRRMDLPAPVGRHTVFRLMRDDLQRFVEESGISRGARVRQQLGALGNSCHGAGTAGRMVRHGTAAGAVGPADHAGGGTGHARQEAGVHAALAYARDAAGPAPERGQDVVP